MIKFQPIVELLCVILAVNFSFLNVTEILDFKEAR